MAVATRHIHHQRLLATANNNAGNDDDLTEDEAKKLSRYLFLSQKSDRDDTNNMNQCFGCCSSTSRNNTTADAEDVIHEENDTNIMDDNVDMKRLNRMDAQWYTLALEPMAIRNERVIMMFEAYTIFGALFLGGTWVLYEWGSPKAYGGNDTDDLVGRVFEFIMAIGVVCNFWLVVTGATGWTPAIAQSSNDPNFLWGAKRILSLCQVLFMSTVMLIAVGVLLGVYLNLNQNGPETIVALLMALLIFVLQSRTIENFFVTIGPLESYHLPFWTRLVVMPYHALSCNGRKDLRTRAIERAKKLKLRRKLYNKQTTKGTKPANLSPSATTSNNNTQQSATTISTSGSIGLLLRDAAKKCGRASCDVSIYEAKLEDDWYDDVEQLKTLSVDILARYMPRRLAEEVQKELAVVAP